MTRKDLATEQLQYLRKGQGITLDKLADCDELLRLLGETRDSVDSAYGKLLSLVEDLKPRSRGALQRAFGLDACEEVTLHGRRHAYATERGRSDDTIENWENAGIRELRLLLLANRPDIRRPAIAAGVHIGEYKIESLEISYRYVDRCFIESIQTREIVAMVDGVDGYIYRTHNSTRLTVVNGGESVVIDHDPDAGWTRHKIVFPERLAVGESHEFAVREEVVDWDGVAPAQDKISQIFHHPTPRFWVEAQFKGDVPPVVWYFDKMTHFERPGRPTSENRLTPVRNRVAHEFYDLFGGLCSGIAWLWE